ncbi:glycosyl hydrolase [Ruminococcus albus]|uniref:glycosyl hydrolase n=1 Tax=Ruminococcus albus TaxID=1264 RepID=UPI000466A458|nr:glycosyl hydrolase [Ruminococcus albus]
MKMRFLSAVIAAVLMSGCLAACGNEIHNNKDVTAELDLLTADEDTTDEETTKEEAVTPVPEEEKTEDEVKSFKEVKIKAAELKYKKHEKTYQAEKGKLNGTAAEASKRNGYEGSGYVSGISQESDWELEFEVPTDQFYNIVLTVGSDEAASGGFSLDGSKYSEFTVINEDNEGRFENISFKNVKLKKGKHKVSFIPDTGIVDIDQVKVTANDEINKLSLNATGAVLSDKEAEYNAKALYRLICNNYGTRVLLAQNDTAGTNYESELIHKVTGKYPAVRLGDMMYVTSTKHADQSAAEIAEALKWYKDGGIVGYMWNWTSPNNPDDNESVYAENAKFNITKAVTDEAIALLDPDTLAQMAEDGTISDECLKIITDIDKVSEQLIKLRDDGVPVLWRPLQEASNGLYWWGKDADSYIWLWQTMYARMTGYHGLHNLVWVWSAQNINWYVGGDYCDVLSADVYGSDKSGQVNALLYLQSVAGGKPIAMSECDRMPLIQNLADEHAMWAYIGQWGGSCIVNEEGGLSEEFNTEKDLITMYNNDLTITRDKLPDLMTMATEIKKEEEKATKDKSKKAKAKKDTED